MPGSTAASWPIGWGLLGKRCRTALGRWRPYPAVGYTGPMNTTEQILAAALDLPAEERARLVDALLQSLDNEASPITEAERQELDRRLDAYHRDPAAGSAWPDVKAGLLARR